ncbi:MAG TPA: hypothetical protein VGM90_11905 [Kofleriaceae bacterium]|jgi:hypothetical protein
MWPLESQAHPLWLALYLLTLAIHVVLISYVAAGSAYALVQAIRKTDDPIAARVRDLLPFMLGLGITAGVAPLLFLQLLYQRRFYTANLIMGPRWGAVVPALVVGFYALYAAKATEVLRMRRLALAVGTLCFGFVAWSWTEIHLLMQTDSVWTQMYAAGERVFADAGVVVRLALWFGAMASAFAAVASWWASSDERRRLAVIGLGGRAFSVAAACALKAQGAAVAQTAHGWLYILAAALVVEAVGWAWQFRTGEERARTLVTGAGTAALLAGVVVREAPRLLLLEPPRPAAAEASGTWVFVAMVLVGVALIAWIVRTVRNAAPDPSH